MPSLVEQVQAHLGPHATFATTIPQFHDVLFATKGTATLLELGIVAATSISCLRLRPDEFSLVWAEMTSHCKEIAEEDRKFRQRDGQEDLVNVSARQVMFEKYWQAASSHSESHNSRGWVCRNRSFSLSPSLLLFPVPAGTIFVRPTIRPRYMSRYDESSGYGPRRRRCSFPGTKGLRPVDDRLRALSRY